MSREIVSWMDSSTGSGFGPRTALTMSLELMSQEAQLIDDFVSLRIARNYVLENNLHPAHAFAQKVISPDLRRDAIKAFAPIIQDEQTSRLPSITPGTVNFGRLAFSWMQSTKRSIFLRDADYGPDVQHGFFNTRRHHLTDVLIDCDAVWDNVPKQERFNLLTYCAAIVTPDLDAELNSRLDEYFAQKKSKNPVIGIDILQRMTARSMAQRPRAQVGRILTTSGQKTSSEIEELIDAMKVESPLLCTRLLELLRSGREAIDLDNFSNALGRWSLLWSARYDPSLDLRWRVDTLDEYLLRNHSTPEDDDIAMDLEILRDEYRQGKRVSFAVSARTNINT